MTNQTKLNDPTDLEFSCGDQTFRLDRNFATYVAVEKALGQSIIGLAAAIPVRGLEIGQIQKILATVARPKCSKKRALEAIEEHGVVRLCDLLGRFFLGVLVGESGKESLGDGDSSAEAAPAKQG